MNPNILFIGAGRRVELLKKFILWGEMWDEPKLYSYELSKEVPVASLAKIIEGMPYNDAYFEDDISSIVDNENIDLVIPCQDAAVVACSKLTNIRHKIVCSNFVTANICYNKKLFETHNDSYDYYPSYIVGSYSIAKPIFGQSGKGIKYLKPYELFVDSDYIVQRKIDGQEWTVDCFFDMRCNFVDAVPRKRLRVFEGEVISSITELNSELYNLVQNIGDRFAFKGPINMQFIQDSDGKFWLTEINARFGGGYTLSIEAGLDAIGLIYRDWLGYKFNYKPLQWKNGLKLERALVDFYF